MKIPFPRRGLNEAWSFTDQPADTSRLETNVRLRDPVTSRKRGASRAGWQKYCPTQLAAAKVKRIAGVTMDNANITFANKSSALTASDNVKEIDTPTGLDAKNAVTDRIGDLYVLDGKAGIVKFTSKGAEVWRLSLPTAKEDHEVRGLCVDPFRNVYASVGIGSDASEARVWRYTPNDETTMRLVWTYEPGGLVTDIEERNGTLYLAVNYPNTGKAEILALTELFDALGPKVAYRAPIPFPANALTVRSDDGAIFTAHEPVFSPNARGKNPQDPNSDPTFVSWTPRDLANWQSRIWSWHEADNINGLGNDGLNEDDEVLGWYDQSEHGRHLYGCVGPFVETLDPTSGATGILTAAPTFNRQAQAGMPGVRFDGVNQMMRSLGNVTDSFNGRNAQKTVVPAYRTARSAAGVTIANSGSAYTWFLLIKADLNEAADVARFLVSHAGADNGGDRHILVNRTASDALTTGITGTDRGRISVWETSGSGHGTAAFRPASGNGAGDFGYHESATFGDAIDNKSGVVLITYRCDGGFQSATYTSVVTHSGLRLNGRPIDRFKSLANFTTNPVYVGGTGIVDASLPLAAAGTIHRFFRGHILASIVIDRGNINLTLPTTEPILHTHQKFGNTTAPVAGDEDWPGASVNQASNEETLIEGYLMWKYGKASNLPRGASAETEYGHPYSYLGNAAPIPLAPTQNPLTDNVNKLISDLGIVAKWTGDSGQPVWARAQDGGIGYDVAVTNSDPGIVFCYGPSTGLQFVNGLTDIGLEISSSWASNIGFSVAGPAFADHYPRLAVDSKNNVYIPIAVDPTSGTDPSGDVIVKNSAGTTIHNYNRAAAQWLTYAIALPPQIPNYPSSLTAQRAPFFYAVGADDNTAPADVTNIVSVSQITETVNTTAPRTRKLVGIVGDTLYTFDSSGKATPTGGAAAFSSLARFIDCVDAFEEIFFTDGLNYKSYDARTNTVSAWEAEQGEIPPRQRLITFHGGRIVLARGDDPHEWFMSAKGKPKATPNSTTTPRGGRNWDFEPASPKVTQAIRGSATRHHACPDVINALVSANDRLLYFGCDHSIYALVGEPLVNDDFVEVSKTIGMAWNTSWAKDEYGMVYFVDNNGDVQRLSGTQVAPLSKESLPRRLRNINLSTHYPVLVWSTTFCGLHVKLCPYGAGGTVVEHYFWEYETDSWRPDTWTAATKQLSAMYVNDGDAPGDRVTLGGTEDGHIVYETEAALSDDGQAIDSRVVIGPIGFHEVEAKLSKFATVLADNQDGCHLKVYSSNEPDVLGHPVIDVMLEPGLNPIIFKTVKGVYNWIELRSSMVGRRWAFESMQADVDPGGRASPKPRADTVGAT